MNQKGQTAIEYILVLFVAAVILTSIYPILEDRLIGDGQCTQSANPPLLCKMISSMELGVINPSANRPTYRHYTLKRVF